MAMTADATTQQLEDKLGPYPQIKQVVDATLAVWPQHLRYLEKRFADDRPESMERCNEFASLGLKVIGDALGEYVADYRWMCEEFLAEEFFFQRNGHYRLSTFAEAYREVYGKPAYMHRYVHGILISQILWHPHAVAFNLFRSRFLPELPTGGSYLEVGPGHGLFLYFAAQTPALARLEAWDVSPSSIAETKAALATLGVGREIEIVEQDVLSAVPREGEFDGAVISEVLEHLERPDRALQTLHSALRSGGRIFINAPVNSPAPDHIYLWRSPEEFRSLVEEQGFEIEQAYDLPQTGVTLEKARKLNVSISCVVIARKP
jgi:2-polyprenyl-3-methyl-5-hydroxy-6-metoxy-1,4-benzoquinol methylase